MPATTRQFTQLERNITASALCAERWPLIRGLRRLQRDFKRQREVDADWQDWHQRYTCAQQAVERRRNHCPSISFPDLPVSHRADEICALIQRHQVVVIAGETGSGKTTQLPKMCLLAGRGMFGTIGHTQPRRVAARSVAQRLADELKSPLGDVVGYQVRFADQSSADGYIKVMTDGILLAEIQRDKFLSRYDTLIIDEAHERSLNIDFLLGYLKKLLPKRPDLKLIITSATIDLEKFSAHFSDAPVLQVSGRNYPVDIVYSQEAQLDSSREQIIVECIDEIQRTGNDGDILVFLSGEREIRETSVAIRRAAMRDLEVVPLYARLSLSEQSKIFSPHRGRRVVLATNVAETSLTVPGIGYVIDTGRARVSRYSYRTKVQRLQIEAISRASANQRAGRCGRVRAGVCYRLYTEDDFERRPEFTDPEVLRTSLAAVILRMLELNIGDIREFPFIDSPDSRMLSDGYKLLEELQAVTATGQLTPVGKKMVAIPLDPRLARMLIEASSTGALTETMVITSALSIQDPRERPVDRQQAADLVHAQWRDADSDFATLHNLWRHLEERRQSLSSNQFAKHCRSHYLSFLRVREWRDLHHQVHSACRKLGFKENRQAANYAGIHRALLSGLLSQVGIRDGRREFIGTRNRRFFIFPASGLAKTPPKWVAAGSLMETNKQYALNVAKIDPAWIEPLATHLVNSSYSQPFYHVRSGQVMAKQRQTLFGLTVVEDKKVQYGHIAPLEAHEVFVQQALVEGGYRGKGDFHAANLRLFDELQSFEDRTRRRDLVVDERALQSFYRERVPESICNLADFEKWRRSVESDGVRVLYMGNQHLLLRELSSDELAQFPESVECDDNQYQLRYHFEPNHPEDGVSVIVPQPLLHQLPRYYFDWLVPGMLRDKCIALIKGLPKQWRRQLVPVPDTVDKLLREITAQNRPLVEVLAEQLQRHFGIAVKATDWQLAKLDRWYQMNYMLVDNNGERIAMGRDAQQLQRDYRQQISGSLVRTPDEQHTRQGLTAWDFDDLPTDVTLSDGKLRVMAWPALRDCGDTVSIELLDSLARAESVSRTGQLRLALIKARDAVRYLSKHLLRNSDLALAAAGLAGREKIVTALISAAVDEALFAAVTVVRNRSEFDACYTQGIGRVVEIAQYQADKIESLLPSLHQIQQKLRALNGPAEYLVRDVEMQLDYLLGPAALYCLRSSRAQQYPRYIKAIEYRLDKWSMQLARDRECSDQIAEFLSPCLEALQSTDNLTIETTDALREFMWFIEEYRVSLFAQQLKTALPVSSKRLTKNWLQLASQLAIARQ